VSVPPVFGVFAGVVAVVVVVVVLVPHEEITEESIKATTSKKLKPNHKTLFFIYLFLPLYFFVLYFSLNSIKSNILPPLNEGANPSYGQTISQDNKLFGYSCGNIFGNIYLVIFGTEYY
jgi:hypothetical protein